MNQSDASRVRDCRQAKIRALAAKVHENNRMVNRLIGFLAVKVRTSRELVDQRVELADNLCRRSSEMMSELSVLFNEGDGVKGNGDDNLVMLEGHDVAAIEE